VADRPSVIVFDVNETLSDMGPMAQRFADVGAPEHLARTWFAMVLRDGFGLAAAGAQRPFAEIAAGVLKTLFTGPGLDRDRDAAVQHVLEGFSRLDTHPDVPDGVRALREAGARLVTLSNGSTQVADQLFTRAGIRDCFDLLLSVEQAGAWKPARAAYRYAAETCGTELADMALVAVHPWDIDGAARAGMTTVWIDRDGGPYPDHLTPPTHTVPSAADLVDRLT
jgi:2-haloacid dehalogenase